MSLTNVAQQAQKKHLKVQQRTGMKEAQRAWADRCVWPVIAGVLNTARLTKDLTPAYKAGTNSSQEGLISLRENSTMIESDFVRSQKYIQTCVKGIYVHLDIYGTPNIEVPHITTSFHVGVTLPPERQGDTL